MATSRGGWRPSSRETPALHSATTSTVGGTCVFEGARLPIQGKIPTPTQAARSAKRTLMTYVTLRLLIKINIYINPHVRKMRLLMIDCEIH